MSAVAPSQPPANQTVFSIGYDFHLGNGDNGNVFGITNYKDPTRNQAFTYDPLNRLISAQNAGSNCAAMTVNNKTAYWGNTYAYDAWGNLLQKSVTKCSAENLNVTVGVNNRISTGGYVYDAAGNMTSNATDSVTATYDAESRIATALKGGVTTTYTYDSGGNRLKKSSGSTGTLYWYMTPGIVAESDLSGVTKSEYVFFNGERVARRDGVNGAGGVFYYFSDHLKTASVITNATGTIKAESDYYPWGGELQFVNADSNHYKFTGKERDTETGLDYFGARYYSNALARFTTVDPLWIKVDRLIDSQRLNLYAYGRNNPLKFTDPTGMDVTLGTCKGGDAQKCFDKTISGLRKEDRSHVHLVAGDGKNGFKKGQYGIMVDAGYKSKSGNFQALQKLANDHSATVQIDVLAAKVTISGTIAVKDSSGNLTLKPLKEALGMDFFLETPWNGQTLFKNWGGPLVEDLWYSNGKNTEVKVLADTSEEIIVETIHHELRHVLLGDFGRAAGKGAHDAPGVNAATRAAEDEARQNRKEK
ncbi:MAG TPA: RHS repeat-associated core domain-containing protein [Candidatus Angelobacter sp.]